MQKTIGLILIATGKYHQFLTRIDSSIREYFFARDNLNIYLFTDRPFEEIENKIGSPRLSINGSIRKVSYFHIPIKHEPWPAPTLDRFKHITQNPIQFTGCDYLFYVDVDAEFIKPVGDNIICGHEDIEIDLIAVNHCGFAGGGWGSPNTPEGSTAFIPENEYQNELYCMGGFQGGKTSKYLNACLQMYNNIEIDKKNGVTAEWSDESHWNHYLIYDPKSAIKILDPTFFMAEEMEGAREKAYILAILKDHNAIRS